MRSVKNTFSIKLASKANNLPAIIMITININVTKSVIIKYLHLSKITLQAFEPPAHILLIPVLSANDKYY